MTLSYEKDVKKLLGDGIYNALLEAVDDDKIDQSAAEVIADQLHPNGAVNFRRQLSSDATPFKRTHFRRILSDWYKCSAFELSHSEAVERLITALKHKNLGEDSRL